MKRRSGRTIRPIQAAWATFALFLALASAAAGLFSASREGRPPGPAVGPRIVDLRGTAYEMGVTHGRTLRTEILELVGRWKRDLEKSFGMPAQDFIRVLLEKTDFRPAIERWTPGLLDEVRGIADGAGLDFETIYAYQLIDEQWAMGEDLSPAKCTTIAARKRNGRPTYVAQNLDLPAFYQGFQTVLRIHDERSGLETLVFTIPGILAANGLNSRSVGVCVNAVTQLAYSPKGVPVDFAVRGLLRQESYEQAERFLREMPPAAPQTYVIGGPDEAAVFERSAGRTARFLPFEEAEFSYHTNHPLVNDDFNPRFPEALKRRGMSLEAYRGRCPRFNFLRSVLTDNSVTIDLDRLKALFADRSSGINNAGTYGCTIMVLGAVPKLHISPGRPDEAPFQALGFDSSPVR